MKNSYMIKYLFVFTLLSFSMTHQAVADELYCREFTQTFTIAGETQQGYGTACLQADGAWKIVKQENISLQTSSKENTAPLQVKEEFVYIVPKTVLVTPRHRYYRKPYPKGRYYRY